MSDTFLNKVDPFEPLPGIDFLPNGQVLIRLSQDKFQFYVKNEFEVGALGTAVQSESRDQLEYRRRIDSVRASRLSAQERIKLGALRLSRFGDTVVQPSNPVFQNFGGFFPVSVWSFFYKPIQFLHGFFKQRGITSGGDHNVR